MTANDVFFTEAGIGALIAVLLEVFPKVKTWWAPLGARQKQASILGIAAVISLASTGLNCFYYGNCPPDWLAVVGEVGMAFFSALTGAVVMYTGTKKLKKPQPDGPETE